MAIPPVNASFYADPTALAGLKRDARAQDPAALKEAAKQFESLFTKMMLKSMREASESFGDSMFSSDQTDFYQGMFDDQLAVTMSQGKGLGLADMLVRQLTQGALAGQQAGSHGLPVEKSASNTSPASQPLASSREDFVRKMMPHAQAAARELGVDPNALLAQAALETGWGKAVPCKANGDCSFNLFGIKAGSQWGGATVNVPTLEFEDGLPVRRTDKFRSYESPADSFRDYAALIGNNPRYQDALGAGSNVAAFAAALQQGGYATDPQYANKIVAVANQVRDMTSVTAFKVSAEVPLPSGGEAV